MTVELIQQRKGKKVGSDEWFTTNDTKLWCLDKLSRVVGEPVTQYDLDPAACYESALAPSYYTLERGEDGLVLPWFGDVWVNMPFSKIRPWVERAWFATTEWNAKNRADTVSLLMPCTKTGQSFWQQLIEPFRDKHTNHGIQPIITTHNLPGRTNFAYPGSCGIPKKGASFSCVLVIFQRFTY